MIIDSPLTFGLTVGADKRIPEEDDARVTVPPLIMPIALMTQPHKVLTASETLINSGINDFVVTLTNGATQTTNLVTLTPGLYELEYHWTVTFNWATAAATLSGFELALNYQGIQIQLGVIPAFVGFHSEYGRVRLLPTSNVIIQAVLSGNGVGQTSLANVMVNVIRQV